MKMTDVHYRSNDLDEASLEEQVRLVKENKHNIKRITKPKARVQMIAYRFIAFMEAPTKAVARKSLRESLGWSICHIHNRDRELELYALRINPHVQEVIDKYPIGTQYKWPCCDSGGKECQPEV